ncbi:TIGR04168 family protein [Leptolyngbya sp. PCC 6406]|uniref:TIGR04168 family protein n=1 Tax=Leptolyngbya sp. PCC 6406 TaxID=1173264 RepID=UPI0002AD0E65|nr:TIGR04168 family protein [Leptolyngbya sp. PCC 6406]
MESQDRTLRIAVVGDVHDQWDGQDAIALHHLQVDLVLLVGDFGNEVVPLVGQIAALDLPKAVVLGNHDAWYTATPWGKKKCPYDPTREDRVQKQLDLLGTAHVGYGKLDLPALGLTVVGGRPFSWGGSDWKNDAFYRERYGVMGWADSTARIVQAVDAAAQDTMIFIGHCGPTGLGHEPESPCGRDWNPLGGDFGEPDLAAAIAHAQNQGKRVPLVTFGHMHHKLRHRKDILRERLATDAQGTVYLNAASVPRVITEGSTCRRNVSLVTLKNDQVQSAALVWIDQDLQIVAEEVLFQQTVPQSTVPQSTASLELLA